MVFGLPEDEMITFVGLLAGDEINDEMISKEVKVKFHIFISIAARQGIKIEFWTQTLSFSYSNWLGNTTSCYFLTAKR